MKISLVYLNREKCANHGVGYIASTILDAGYELHFVDTAYTTIEETLEDLKNRGPDLLLMSASSLFYGQATRLATEFRLFSRAPVLLGGVHATMVGGQVLRDCPAIDYACVGEGEGFVLEFLSAMQSGRDVRGVDNLAYRQDGEVVENPIRPCTDLSMLPNFRHDVWAPFSVVQPHPFPGMCYVYATRGCPYACTYCGNSRYLQMYKKGYLRTQPVDRVIEDLVYLKSRYPAQFLFFGDEMVVFDEGYVSELFPRIRDEVQMPYGCMARVEHVTPSLVELLRTTGCQYVGMGVECGDERFRREFLNRHMSNDQIIEAFDRLRAIPSIKLTSYNMCQYPVPYDDELTQATHALNARLRPDIMQMSIFFPLRGTKLYDYCVEHDLIDWGAMANSDDVFTRSVLRRDKIQRMEIER